MHWDNQYQQHKDELSTLDGCALRSAESLLLRRLAHMCSTYAMMATLAYQVDINHKKSSLMALNRFLHNHIGPVMCTLSSEPEGPSNIPSASMEMAKETVS